MCDTRCGHAPAQKTVRTVRWVCPEARDNFRRSKSWKSLHRGGRGRGRRGTNRELRGRSCEKPRAQDRRGVIFDADDDDADDNDVDLEL